MGGVLLTDVVGIFLNIADSTLLACDTNPVIIGFDQAFFSSFYKSWCLKTKRLQCRRQNVADLPCRYCTAQDHCRWKQEAGRFPARYCSLRAG